MKEDVEILKMRNINEESLMNIKTTFKNEKKYLASYKNGRDTEA